MVRAHIAELMEAAGTAARYLVATAAAFLPRRLWPMMEERWPIFATAVPSALASLLAGVVMGIPGFLRYAGVTAAVNTEIMLRIANEPPSGGRAHVTSAAPVAFTAPSLLAFVFFTPLGLVSAYLVTSGALRLIAALVDEPMGDPILTGLDLWSVRRRRRISSERVIAERARLGGADVPDLLMTGPQAGLPSAELAVVSARPKAGWEEGVLVITDEAWFRIGRVFEEMHPGGLRTVYPLKRVPETEVLRRAVTYTLPRGTGNGVH